MLTTPDVSDIPSIPSAPTMQPVVLNSSPLKDKKLILGVLAGLVILALISAAAFGAYQLGKNQATNPPSTVATPSNLVATPSTTPVVAPVPNPTYETAGFKTYDHAKVENLTGIKALHIEYPESWKLSVLEMQNSIGFVVKLTKSNSKLAITQAPMGGGGCLFPGDPDIVGPYGRFNEPTTIFSSGDMVWKRAVSLANTAVNPRPYGVCQCTVGKVDSCGGLTSIGGVSYEVPISDNELLSEMDSIIRSALSTK